MENNTVSYKIDLSTHPTLAQVLENIVDECTRSGDKAAVVSFADCPFINEGLTRELVERHMKYAAEYTFADGYPGGLAPEVLDAGTARILLEMVKRDSGGFDTILSKGVAQGVAKSLNHQLYEQPMTRTGLWDLIKTDVNAFEVETVIAPHDYRLWRLDFHTGDKRGALSCHAVEVVLGKDAAEIAKMNADEVCQTAIRDIHAVRTVPAFYQVEVSGSSSAPKGCIETTHQGMPLDRFNDLVGQMKALSGDAVVSIDSADPAYVEVLSKAGLDILIETGDEVSDEVAARCHDIDPDIRWIVECRSSRSSSVFLPPSCAATETKKCIETTTPTDENIALLHKYFPGRVYPQLVRTTETEPMLEEFYRKWAAADSPSGGKVLITKYCSYCGTLPDLKPADLSPLERNPCWHLRRDMVILADGTVLLCFARKHSLGDEGNILGNAFDEGLAALWDKMEPYAERDLQYCLAANPVVESGSLNSKPNRSSSVFLPPSCAATETKKCIETTTSGGVSRRPLDDLCRKCDEYYTFNF